METENLYAEKSIRTFKGVYLNVWEPDPEKILIEDIAHALSYQCRFGGHMESFYSVAQHSYSCAMMFEDKKTKLQALMHDASEAYLLDIPRPIKNHLSNYKDIENTLMIAIAKKFGFEWPMSDIVKEVDELMLQFEWNNLILKNTGIQSQDTAICQKIYGIKLTIPYVPVWSHKEAEHWFLTMFNSLTR